MKKKTFHSYIYSQRNTKTSQSSTFYQSEDNNYLQDVLNVLGPYSFDCTPGFKWVSASWKLEPIQNPSK